MRRRLRSLVLAALLLTGSPALAAPPSVDDVILTIKIRQMLYRDDDLRPHNIGVQVVDRVAILFGPVPSLDVGLRAESRLRGLIELRDVRNDLDVVTPLPELLPERIPAPAPLPGLEPRPQRPGLGSDVPAEVRSRPAVTMIWSGRPDES